MALTLTKSLPTITPAKNQAEIEVSTDAYVSVAGSFAEAIIQLDTTPTTGNFIFGNTLKSQTFTFETAPNNGGLQLPRNTGAFTSAVQAERTIAALRANYYVNRDYVITLNSTSVSTYVLKFTARKRGIAYNVTSSGTVASYSLVSNTAGVDRVVLANFSVLLDLFAEKTFNSGNDELVYSAEGKPDANNKVLFNVQRVLEAITGYAIPAFASAAYFTQTGMKRVYARLCEAYGTPPVPQKYVSAGSESSYITALHGASRNSKYPYTNYGSPFYKTTMQSGKLAVHKLQKQFLTFYNNVPNGEGIGYFMRGEVKLYYTDGTSSGWLTLFSDVVADEDALSRSGWITANAGYTQLDIDTLKASGKTVAKYEVRYGGVTAEDDAVENAAFIFIVDQNNHRFARTYLFINSFGFPETVFFTGLQARGLEVERTTVQRHRINVDTTNAIVHGEYDDTNVQYQEPYELTSGLKDKATIDYYRDILTSPAHYLQGATQWIKQNLAGGGIKMDMDDDTLFVVSLKMKPAMNERGEG